VSYVYLTTSTSHSCILKQKVTGVAEWLLVCVSSRLWLKNQWTNWNWHQKFIFGTRVWRSKWTHHDTLLCPTQSNAKIFLSQFTKAIWGVKSFVVSREDAQVRNQERVLSERLAGNRLIQVNLENGRVTVSVCVSASVCVCVLICWVHLNCAMHWSF